MTSSQLEVQFGKVRINTAISKRERILTSTPRISAFDCVLPFDVESKGQILQAISVFFFINTRDIIPNHFIGCLDAQSMLVRSGKVLPLEVIVRCTLSGSLWKTYSASGPAEVRQVFGVELPDGLAQHARFSKPIVTFTTKAAFGHDETVTPAQATLHLEQWLNALNTDEPATATAEDASSIFKSPDQAQNLLSQVTDAALKLFDRGQEISEKSGLLLLDTKYEFALDEKRQLMLADEIHTPDASRYVDLELFRSGKIEHLSKEWLREIVQREESAFLKNAPEPEKNSPFVLRPFWQSDSFSESLAAGLSGQYKKLFARLFPELTPWDVVSAHLQPWPVDPNSVRSAEARQRLPSKVLVIGNGGRDYTLASFIEKAAEVDVVYCFPGRESWNGGKKASLNKLSSDQLVEFCKTHKIGWAVFGPEIPIAQGLAEKLRTAGIPCLAPDLAGAMLESSKIYTKEILQRAACPTAEAWTAGWAELKSLVEKTDGGKPPAHAVLDQYPYVLKYESLAAGKGVCLVFNENERKQAIEHFSENLAAWSADLAGLAVDTYTRRIGEPQFLVEKLLPGREISAIALCHGEEFCLLPYAQDFKRRNDGQSGPNTGGMGSVCPVPLSPELDEQVRDIFRKTLKTLASEGKPYSGFLFAGLMVDDNNFAQVLEFNCRLGDPETQVILPGLGRDLLLNMWLTSLNLPWSGNPWAQNLQPNVVRHDGLQRCFVVVASPEYPNGSAPRRTLQIPENMKAGCNWIPSGVDAGNSTSAGRIGGVLSAAAHKEQAVRSCYNVVPQIRFAGENSAIPHFRRDICFPNLNGAPAAK